MSTWTNISKNSATWVNESELGDDILLQDMNEPLQNYDNPLNQFGEISWTNATKN